MKLIEPIRQNPVVFRLGDSRSYAVVGSEYSHEPLVLDNRVAITGDCFGMNIYTADGRREYYGTQSKIVSAEIKDEYLVVYEEGKSIPWKFSPNGVIVNRACFDEKTSEDVRYVKHKYGYSKRDIPNLNDYEAYVEYVMLIEERIQRPITIDLKDPHYSRECFLDKEGKYNVPFEYLDTNIFVGTEKLPLSKGVMLSEKNPCYGFKVISVRKSETFPTQCPLVGVQVIDGMIHILEQGKTTHWHIDINGDVHEYAKFVDVSRRDIKYLNEKFGLSGEDVENVNSYGLKYVNKEN